MRFLLLLGLGLLLAACASGRSRGVDPNAVTLCVANNTAGMGTLRVWSDRFGRILNVPSGERHCRPLGTGITQVQLYAETIGGGSHGPARGSAVLPSHPGECWLWSFQGHNDDGNLVPCDFLREDPR